MRNKELHTSRLGEDADSPTCNFAELPVGFGCRVAEYYFTWTILVATDGSGRIEDSMADPQQIKDPAITISVLTIDDLDAVDELMKRYGSTLGFLPRASLEDYLQKEGVLGARTQDGRLVGYLMYAANRDRFRIAQTLRIGGPQGPGRREAASRSSEGVRDHPKGHNAQVS